MTLFEIFYCIGFGLAFCIMLNFMLSEQYESGDPDFFIVILGVIASLLVAVFSWAFVACVLLAVCVNACFKFFKGGGYDELKDKLSERREKRKVEKMYSNNM